MTSTDASVFHRLERFYDAVPRGSATVEEIGEMVIFARQGAGWPYYARPRLGFSRIGTACIAEPDPTVPQPDPARTQQEPATRARPDTTG